MIIANGNHMIIKNHFGKKPITLKISLNFYVKNLLFIYSDVLHSGNHTSGSNFIPSISQNEGGFHGIVFGKRTISK